MLCEFDLHLRNGAKRSKLNWPRTGGNGMMARKLKDQPTVAECSTFIRNLLVLFQDLLLEVYFIIFGGAPLCNLKESYIDIYKKI